MQTLPKLAPRLLRSMPLCKRERNSTATLLGGGNNGVWAMCPDNSHKERKITIGM